MKKDHFLLLGAMFGMLAVILGAFGAHGLERMVDAKMLQRFHTGVEYQFYHAFALLLTGLLAGQHPHPSRWFPRAGVAFVVGILIFSGSLYAYVLSGVRGFGMITPIGGLSFILGWLFLILSSREQKTPHTTGN